VLDVTIRPPFDLCANAVTARSISRADAPHSLGLLRPRHHRPSRRASKSRDELSPSHP
jgi:hypothetical protein